MSDFAVALAPLAEQDIADAFCWYRKRNALVADSFRTEVFDAIDRIASAPLSKPVDDAGNRNRVLRRFPYSVFYEVTATTIVVLAVAHHRRRPNYWRSSPT